MREKMVMLTLLKGQVTLELQSRISNKEKYRTRD